MKQVRPLVLARSRFWLLPLGIGTLMLLTLFLRNASEVRAQSKIHAKYTEIQSLMEAGFYSQAMDRAEEIPPSKNSQGNLLLFDVALRNERFERAEELWRDLRSEDAPPALKELMEAEIAKGEEARAWDFLTVQEKELPPDYVQRYAIQLLSVVKEVPARANYIGGWYHSGLSILQDQNGMYLIDGQGDTIQSSRFEELIATHTGFLARNGNQWIAMDASGRYTGIANPPEGLEKVIVQESFPLAPYKDEAGHYGYQWEGKTVLPAVYEYAGPISAYGVAYAFSEGKWMRLQFEALRDGHTFNKIGDD